MVEVYEKEATGKYSQLFVLYRNGHPVHIHSERKVFEDWMKTAAWLYRPSECEIVRFVPDASPKCATCGEPLSRDCPRCKRNWES